MKKKIIAALGLLVVINTPSADAMEIEPCWTMDRETYFGLSRDSHYKPAPIVVDLRHGLPNGFIGILRDVTIGLMTVVKDKELVRRILGMCREVLLHSKSRYFKHKYRAPYWDVSVRCRTGANTNYSLNPGVAKTLWNVGLVDVIAYFDHYSNPHRRNAPPNRKLSVLASRMDRHVVEFFTTGPQSSAENLMLLKFLMPYMDNRWLNSILAEFDPRKSQPLAYAVCEELVGRNELIGDCILQFLVLNTLFLRSPYHPKTGSESILYKLLNDDSAFFLKHYRIQKTRTEIPAADQQLAVHLNTLLDHWIGDYWTYTATFGHLAYPVYHLASLRAEGTRLLKSMGAKTGKQVLAAVGIQDDDYK